MIQETRYWCKFHEQNATASDWKEWRERKKEYDCVIIKIVEIRHGR